MSTSGTVPALDLSIDVQKDLSSGSQLKALIQQEAKPVFTFAEQLRPYWTKPIAETPDQTSTAINLKEQASWTVPAGISFGLTAGADCKLEVVKSGALMQYAPSIESTQPTASLPAAAYPGFAYVKLSLDFTIGGSVSGSGSVSGLGISGNAKGSAETSLVFCHRVADTMTLQTAVTEAFEKLVFPLHPACATSMGVGDLAEVTFHGTLNCELDLTYGIRNLNFSAPSVDTVLQSAKVPGVSGFSLPQAKVDIGAKANVGYKHEDDFTGIVERRGAQDAFLYVLRADRKDWREGASVSAEVTITGTAGVIPDPQSIQRAVDGAFGGGGAAAAAKANELAQKLNGKLNDWIANEAKQGASLGLLWDQQHNSMRLFQFQVVLNNLPAVKESWDQLCDGNLAAAVGMAGLRPLPGSGISDEISRSFGVNFHFFNLFSAGTTDTFFQKSQLVITDAGDLRYLYDVGKEGDAEVNKASRVCRIHFVATADQTDPTSIKDADVDLQLELSASNDKAEAARIANTVLFIPSDEQANLANKAMQRFLAGPAQGASLNLVCILKRSAYGRLSCSEFVNSQPPENQLQDQLNWEAFHMATNSLMKIDPLRTLEYSDWETFNRTAIDRPGSTITPDRRSKGNWLANSALADVPVAVKYFLLNSAGFMDLCDDLHSLTGLVANVSTVATWNDLLDRLAGMIVNAVNTDYSKPAIAALLQLSNPHVASYQPQSGTNSLTCTLTLA
jgi:hypothetical protein